MDGFVFVDIKAAAGLDAIGATGAVLTPVNAAELAYPVKSARGWDRINMVTIGHFLISHKNHMRLFGNPALECASFACVSPTRRRQQTAALQGSPHNPACLITSAASDSRPPLRMWMPRTPGIALSRIAISEAMAAPSLAGFAALSIRAMTSSPIGPYA